MPIYRGQIGDIISKIMDNAFLDIYRNIVGVPKHVLLYSNVPCNVNVKKGIDNPNPLSVDIMPIISMIQIATPIWADIQNGDYLIAKQVDKNNEILISYRGICGFPAVTQSRQYVLMQMNAAATPDEPIAPPPLNPSQITIKYFDVDLSEIKATMINVVPIGEEVTIYTTQIQNYTYLRSYLDDVLQTETNIIISDPKPEGHEVIFMYEKLSIPTFIKILSFGAFTRNDGSFAFGWHLHSVLPVGTIETYDYGKYDLRISVDRILQPDMGVILLTSGTVIKIFGVNEWAQIISTPEEQSDGTFIIETDAFYPNNEQENAIETSWYDV